MPRLLTGADGPDEVIIPLSQSDDGVVSFTHQVLAYRFEWRVWLPPGAEKSWKRGTWR